MDKISENAPRILEVTAENLADEHICCAIGGNKDAKLCAESKKNWMQNAYADGYHFWKLNVQGKVFVEAIPAQNAWCPIEADNWLFIDCFWISGQYKGKGYGRMLFITAHDYALQNSFAGICALAADKKRPFLSDAKFYRHLGFTLADTAPPYYELLALPFQGGTPLPQFLPVAKKQTSRESGLVLYHSNHCPHTSKYVPLLLNVAAELGVPATGHKLENKANARAVPNPFPTYAMFYNNRFITNEMFSEGKMRKFLEEQAKTEDTPNP